MSLRARFLLAFLLIVLVTIATVSVSVRLTTERQVEVIRARGGWIGAEELVAELQAHYRDHGSWEGVDSILHTQGRGMGSGSPGGQGGMGNRPGVRLADAQGTLVFDPENPAGGSVTKELLQDGISLNVDGKTAGYLLPLEGQVFSGSEFDDQLLDVVNTASIYAALISGGLALILALLLAYFLLRPVQQLTQAAKDMSEGDLSRRVKAGGGGELVMLGRSFNQMAASLQEAEKRRSDMAADIAHELRTPLSIQRANLEAMLDGVYALDNRNLEKVLDQNALLTRLVQDLRTLTLADAGELKLELTAVNLNEFTARVVSRFQPEAERKSIRIQSVLPDDIIHTQADPQRLEQILNNLLHNALRYTPEGGRITLKLTQEAERVVLQVHDSGPGIPEESLPHIFERFYRSDRGRARDDGGSGLGLAIARKLAEAQGGSLMAKNHPEGGAAFVLSLRRQR